MRLVLRKPFEELWRDYDAFEAAFSLQGEEFRRVKSRRTFRIEVDGRGYFVKLHRGVGWREIFKNLFQFKLPVLGADNEFDAVEKLHALNVPTMNCAAFGRRGGNPAQRESFLITEEITGTVSLEDVAKERPSSLERIRLGRVLAQEAGAMHRAGVNHRDCYLCHFLVKKTELQSKHPALYIIDLHRAQIRKEVPARYLLKDLGGLYFSALDSGLTKRDVLRFIRNYSMNPLELELREKGDFWRAVRRTGEKLYRKEFGKDPGKIF